MRTNEIMLLDRIRARKYVPEPPPLFHPEIEITVILLDGSYSMEEPDYLPNRYLAGVDAAEGYIAVKIRQSPNDLIAAVVFDSSARTVVQPVRVSQGGRTIVSNLRKIHPDDGTDITQGLNAAGRILAKQPKNYRKRIVLLTDGWGGEPEKKSQELQDNGTIIDVVGIGGSPKEVNEECLKRCASVVNGKLRYRFIGDGDSAELLSHFRKIATDLVKVR